MYLNELEENTLIHCKTREEAETLLEELEAIGYEWADGKRLTSESRFDTHESNTYYHVFGTPDIDPGITYGSMISYYVIEGMGRHAHHVEFSDIEFEAENISGEEPYSLKELFG